MPEFTARVRCIYNELWSVDASSAEEARKLFEDLDERVATDDQGECVDWTIGSIKQEPA